jgi:hypothetical protein
LKLPKIRKVLYGLDMSAATHIPFFDRNVEHVPVSKVRYMNTAQLRGLDHAMLIEASTGPVAVVISYGAYMILQALMEAQMSPILDRMAVVE